VHEYTLRLLFVESTGPEEGIVDIFNGQLPAIHLLDFFCDAGSAVIIAFFGDTFAKSV
jgi:hypothetical protein